MSMDDLVRRQDVIDRLEVNRPKVDKDSDRQRARLSQWKADREAVLSVTAVPERIWYSCENPPRHHNDVIVRGIEAISGGAVVCKVMQWDVDKWKPVDYAPSIAWKEWAEI